MSECEMCSNYSYDEELDDWSCEACFEEDDMARLRQDQHQPCPYWHSNDEYRMVKHQSVGHLPGYSDLGYFLREEKPEDEA